MKKDKKLEIQFMTLSLQIELKDFLSQAHPCMGKQSSDGKHPNKL